MGPFFCFDKDSMGRKPVPIEERFWSKVNKTRACWLWAATVNNSGYGLIKFNGRPMSAHRWSWRLAYGAIPRNKLVLHTCDVRNCVRPDHLFLGTSKDNVQDAVTKGRWTQGSTGVWGTPLKNKLKTVCPKGHLYDRVYSVVQRSGRIGLMRQCSVCKNAQRRRQKPV